MRSGPGRPGAGPAAGGVAFIAALGSERRVLERQALGSPACAVYQSGPGAVAAAAAAAQAVRDGARRLVSWGLAGGLAELAVTGRVVLPDRIVSIEAAPIAVDADWRARLQALLADPFDPLGGNLATTAAVLTTPAAKARTAESLDAVAVDMESRAIAEAAAQARLPFVAVRVVADGPGDALPADVDRLVDARGNVRPFAAIVSVLRAPAGAVRLGRLGRQSAQAHRTLAQVAAVLTADRFGVGTGLAGDGL